MNKLNLILAISNLLDNLVQVDLKRPFVPEKAGEQEEVVGVFKNENGELELLTWNFDNGGNRKEEVYNQTYPFTSDLLTKDELKEILSQLIESAEEK